MVNPSLGPTRPDGLELPTISYRGEGIRRALAVPFHWHFIGVLSHYGDVINSMNPRDAHMRHWIESPLTPVMGWCLLGAKPLPEPILIYKHVHPKEHIAVKFFLKIHTFPLKKCICNWYAKWWSSCLGLNMLNMGLIYTNTTAIIYSPNAHRIRNNSVYGLSQWEDVSLCNAFSHWPNSYSKWFLTSNHVNKTPTEATFRQACYHSDYVNPLYIQKQHEFLT